MCSVTWPLSGNEVGVNLFSYKSHCFSYVNTNKLPREQHDFQCLLHSLLSSLQGERVQMRAGGARIGGLWESSERETGNEAVIFMIWEFFSLRILEKGKKARYTRLGTVPFPV